MVLLPILIASFFMVADLRHFYQVYTTMSKADVLGSIATKANSLVHEVQRERGASALYLDSKGKKFESEMLRQRRITDQVLNAYYTDISMLQEKIESADMHALISQIRSSLSRLSSIRNEVSSQRIKASAAVDYYTQTNKYLLDISSLISTLVNDAEFSNLVSAYVNFLESKERAGIERAVLSSIFAKDEASAGDIEKFVTLLAEQNTYLDVYEGFVSKDVERDINSLLSGESISEVKRIRDQVLHNNSGSGFNVDPTYWFRMASNRIDRLKDAEVILSTQVLEYISQARAAALSDLLGLVIIAVVSVTGMLIVVGYLLKRINWQIRVLTAAMLKIREHSDLTSRAESGSRDELGKLAIDFNAMVVALGGLASSVGEASRDLSGMVSEIHAVSDSVNSEVQSGLAQADSVAVAVSQMEAAVQGVVETSSNTAHKSRAAHAAATEGEKLVTAATRVMQRLSGEMSGSMQVIEQVAADSKDIGGVLDVINGIAEQTNLLALNAAIEAARAGEQGRGFAVVADEVRTLASKTAESTLQIQSMIEQLQGRSELAVRSMTDSKACAAETASSFDQILTQLKEITHQSSQVSDMNIQNATATEQQSATVDDINSNVIDIQSRYHQANASVSRLKTTSLSLGSVASRLSGEVSQFVV